MVTPATIAVEFKANYAGAHRVCYRIGNSGAYTCISVVCAGEGATCTQDITVNVDNETCDQVEFQGYIQPACVDIASEEKRVAFSYTFTPSPTCLRYLVTCDNVSVASASITNPGTGYTVGAPPALVVSGGGGVGATAAAVVGDGAILTENISFNANGTGYNDGVYTNVGLLGGTGSGALGSFTVIGGIVTTGLITDGGNGYLNGEVLSPDPADLGGSTPLTQAEFAIASDYGTIIQVNITSPGSGYTTPPAITIPPSGGVTATAVSVLSVCPEINTDGCSGTPGVIPASLEVGDTVSICKVGAAPSLSSQFTVSQNGNCTCNCVDTIIAITDLGGGVGSLYYSYNRCNGEYVEGTISIGGSPSTINDCAVAGSVITTVLSGNIEANVTYGDACS